MSETFIRTVQQFFPNSVVVDAALEFPITKPGKDECRFNEPDFRLVLNLQDMLTETSGLIKELHDIHTFYADWADLNRIIVVVWPQSVLVDFPESSFNLVEFSTHQYEIWENYKAAEDILRDTFSSDKKSYEYNFVCMNRHDKPHRRKVYGLLQHLEGNISFQTEGKELAYPGLTFNQYESNYDNLQNLLSLAENFNTALFSVITESQYAETHGIITEKTFNAIVAGQPFLMVGHQNALSNIKGYGFKTFSGFFDEDYDISSNNTRIEHLINSNILNLGTKMAEVEMYYIAEELRDITDYNRNFFFEDFGRTQLAWLRAQLLNIWN